MVGEEVQTRGICGTYSQGLDWITQSLGSTDPSDSRPNSPGTQRWTADEPERRRALLWLGSSIGNFSPQEALTFLRDEVRPALHAHTRILIGIDNCKVPEKVQLAYDDSEGVTRQFILNGITVVARALGLPESILNPSQFEYVSRYNVGMSRNEAYLRAREDIMITTPAIEIAGGERQKEVVVRIKSGELILMEHSYKFTDEEAHNLFHFAGLRVVQSWSDQSHLPADLRLSTGPNHTLYLVECPGFTFGELPESVGLMKVGRHAKGNVPSLKEWAAIWTAWDSVTMGIIPEHLLHSKPIDLRHICLFYLGHIPVFADIQLSRYFKVPYSEPQKFSEIFERGIDPNMEDPSQCHDHSKVPDREDEWPSLDQILKFRDSLRDRISNVYLSIGASESDGDPIVLTRALARVLWMIYEHEAMHLETLLYMLVQMESVNFPPNFTPPDWRSLSRRWDLEAAATEDGRSEGLIEYPKQISLQVGHNDRESDDNRLSFSADHEFGWDNENPARVEIVNPFMLSPKPVSNSQYLAYLHEILLNGSSLTAKDLPASWKHDFESSNSLNDIKIRTIYGLVPFPVGQHWPVQASGRQLAAYARARGGRLPSANELRVYFQDSPPGGLMSSIGFQHWHPIPARGPTKDEDGTWRGGMNGGVWEWTGTPFDRHEGFESSSIYPGYSSDFFDGSHWIMLGASWATLPRIAQRKSFTNWYQANYPYVFAGARVAYDY
ncbi:hypothetical protein CROQUDRAFT_48628 [Cronartium quercuum f. sp. fusiforme G11]|uniref:DUF323 domain-containing protein n=1 Tax=Cronartium quercuum f. sp. fusiforme G11 TaxID=708437 RepID=A0A9P6NGA1_9BASI|nr:hypothetical protein CROQUDRAFT_48628 [Cronartium quercuum f. sp. fusiforme G11]